MPRKSNSKGHCKERNIEILGVNLCDYFDRKKKNGKPICRNCTHFCQIKNTINQQQEEPNQS